MFKKPIKMDESGTLQVWIDLFLGIFIIFYSEDFFFTYLGLLILTYNKSHLYSYNFLLIFV